MPLPILHKCPFCGSKIQHFIGHVSGHYAYFCTQSKKLIILEEDLHEKLVHSDSGLNPKDKDRVRIHFHKTDSFEITLSLEKIRYITEKTSSYKGKTTT